MAGTTPQGGCLTSAPGKLILFGEHAVVYDRKGIATAVDLRTKISLNVCSGDEFQIIRPSPFRPVSFPLYLLEDIAKNILPTVKSDWAAYLKQITEILYTPELQLTISAALSKHYKANPNERSISLEKDLGCLSALSLFCFLMMNNGNFDSAWRLETYSDLPIGAGLGSSSAYHVGLAGAFLKCSPKLKNAALTEDQWKFWSNELAFSLEKIVHGPKASGIDNMISVYGGVLVYHKKSPSFRTKIPKLDVLITNTKFPRDTKNLINIVRTKHTLFPEVIDHVLDAIEGISNAYEELLDEEDVDEERIGELFNLNHDLLRTLGVSHQSLEDIVSVLKKHYALNTKLTGAGGGGCAITLLPQKIVEANLLPNIINTVETLPGYKFECFTTTIGAEGLICHHHTHTT